jgi:hypothetical protein
MNEILKLIKDAIGVKPLLPLLLIIAIGYVVVTVKGYSIRQLAHDRFFLILSLAILFVGIAYWIWTSNEAQPTARGLTGVYVAKLADDRENKLQRALIEHLTANIKTKAIAEQVPVEILDLKREIDNAEENEQRLNALLTEMNAAVIIWGSVVSEKGAYLRVWNANQKLARRTEPTDLTDLRQLADFSELVWSHAHEVAKPAKKPEPQDMFVSKSDFESLKSEVIALRSMITTSIATPSSAARPQASGKRKLTALMIAVADYKEFPLQGPINDTKVLAKQLQASSSSLNLKTLTDAGATKSAIYAALDSVLNQVPEDETLVVYFSGHSLKAAGGKTAFLPFDVDMKNPESNAIWYEDVIRKVMLGHKRTVLLIDGALSEPSIPADALSEGFILAAGDSPNKVFESVVDGQAGGAFTQALVKSLAAVPPEVHIEPDHLYSAVSALLKSGKFSGQPVLVKGKSARAL